MDNAIPEGFIILNDYIPSELKEKRKCKDFFRLGYVCNELSLISLDTGIETHKLKKIIGKGRYKKTTCHANILPLFLKWVKGTPATVRMSYPEREIQKRYTQRFTCETEVATPVGFIDVVTDDEVIEIKYFQRWKQGLGQLLLYGISFPDKTRVLHLFGFRDNTGILDKIKYYCAHYGVITRFSP